MAVRVRVPRRDGEHEGGGEGDGRARGRVPEAEGRRVEAVAEGLLGVVGELEDAGGGDDGRAGGHHFAGGEAVVHELLDAGDVPREQEQDYRGQPPLKHGDDRREQWKRVTVASG